MSLKKRNKQKFDKAINVLTERGEPITMKSIAGVLGKSRQAVYYYCMRNGVMVAHMREAQRRTLVVAAVRALGLDTQNYGAHHLVRLAGYARDNNAYELLTGAGIPCLLKGSTRRRSPFLRAVAALGSETANYTPQELAELCGYPNRSNPHSELLRAGIPYRTTRGRSLATPRGIGA